VRAGRAPKVFGDGSETKHFVYVGDLARANAAAFEAAATDVAVNTSGPAPISTLELVRLVTEIAGGGPEPEFIGETPGKVRLTSGGAFDIVHGEAKRVLNWEPQMQMREGLTRLMAWLEQDRAKNS
jgi:UDP-glucose 4-epimerase